MSDEFIGTVIGIAICVAVAGVILLALFSGKPRHKRTRSRSEFTHGIDDVDIDD